MDLIAWLVTHCYCYGQIKQEGISVVVETMSICLSSSSFAFNNKK